MESKLKGGEIRGGEVSQNKGNVNTVGVRSIIHLHLDKC